MGSSGDRLCQTSPIPRSPDGDNNVEGPNKRQSSKMIQHFVSLWVGVGFMCSARRPGRKWPRHFDFEL